MLTSGDLPHPFYTLQPALASSRSEIWHGQSKTKEALIPRMCSKVYSRRIPGEKEGEYRKHGSIQTLVRRQWDWLLANQVWSEGKGEGKGLHHKRNHKRGA